MGMVLKCLGDVWRRDPGTACLVTDTTQHRPAPFLPVRTSAHVGPFHASRCASRRTSGRPSLSELPCAVPSKRTVEASERAHTPRARRRPAPRPPPSCPEGAMQGSCGRGVEARARVRRCLLRQSPPPKARRARSKVRSDTGNPAGTQQHHARGSKTPKHHNTPLPPLSLPFCSRLVPEACSNRHRDPLLPKAPPYLIAGQVARVSNLHFRVHFAVAPTTLATYFAPGGVLVHAATFGVLAAR